MKQDKNKNKNEHMSMQHFIYTHFLELFDTFKEEKIDENICQKALNVLCQSKISNKYKLILPLFKDFDIQNGEVVINGLIEEPVWLYDSSDPILLDRVRIHTRLQKGITDTYCKTDLGSSILIMESGTNQNLQKICVTIESSEDLTYKMGLDKSESANFLVSQAKDDKKTISTDLEQIDLSDIHIEVRNKLKEQKIKENNELCDGIRAHYPFLVGNRYIVYYFFPNNIENFSVQNNITNKYKRVGNGGVFVVSNQKLGGKEKSFFLSLAYLLGNKLAIKRSNIRLKKESLKSAVSAIMTRNMSHNLGSHYLHYTKAQLEQLAKNGGEFGPDIRGAARVMGYMQGRMDYLATLVSMDRYPYGCVNFKSQIFDELTIDDFSKRHFEKDIISNDEVRNVIVLLKRLQREDNKREIVKANLESLYELSKKALTNKSHNRTTNFLLTNLILSENFTRPSILDDNSSSNSDLKMINLQVLLDLKDENEESYTKIFTGTLAKKDDEEIVKRKLSKVNIALPGGVMSSHAFFNIVENFIRNSAKYLQTDFSKSGNLTITIKIKEIDGYYEFTLFDDKQNANKKQPDTNKSLLDNLLDKISNLRILDDNKALDKKDKGFKEMLFSALWLRSYMYQNISDNDLPQSYEEVLVKMESVDKENTEKRLVLIKQYGFELLAVDDNGNESKEDNANLALRWSLPKFCPKTMMELSDNALPVNLSNLLHIYADVAMIEDAKQYTSFVEQLNKKRRTEKKDIYDEDMIIPRLLKLSNVKALNEVLHAKHKKELSNVEALNEVLHARFGDDFDNYEIVSGSFENDNLSTPIADNKKIYFQRHLSTQDVIDHYKGYAYADSVSGGNYTITLFDLYERWAKEGREPDSEYYYQILKIKESALTRITIIDERFFKKMKEQQLETELACKNIRVLNYNESMSKETEMAKLLEGNEFNNHENHTHFLSIHLGIIEKIIKNVDMFKKMENSNEKVKVFMKMLKEYFGPKVFISIHSGRGNFSAELEDALDMYPFISMAALENAYENSKYLLAQLFYSTIYIGKGVANHDN